MNKQKILLVGTGLIAQEYAKILKVLGSDINVIGRGSENAKRFTESTGIDVTVGGIESFLSTNQVQYDAAIVAVNIEYLSAVTIAIVRHGIKRVLVEKPGGNSYAEISLIAQEADRQGAKVLLAYNRRFFASVLKAKEIIRQDGGVSSFNFEFTEWGHEIEKLPQGPEIKRNWLMANSSHVIDMAFFMGGWPESICSFSAGELSWHKPSAFAGAGTTKAGALFSYQANWDAPGRWGVEILTKKHRLIFRPLEKLQVQKKGFVEISFAELDYSRDTEFKPGFYEQVRAFLDGEFAELCSIQEQKIKIETVYNKISGN